jgi:hypothetical protein
MRHRVRHTLLLTLAVIASAAVTTYLGDFAILRYRVSMQKNPFGQVTVTTYFASSLKNGHTEYDFQQPQNETCVNALYPHMGMQPCWYLRRHPERRIDLM